MPARALFGLSILMSVVSSAIAARLFVWPRVRAIERESALVPLVAFHMIRFIGLSFLVPGVVSPSLPAAFAAPAAYGDFVSCILAAVATVALSRRAPWAIPAVWVFNVWGTADLLFAFYQGPRIGLEPGTLGAAYFIITVIVPALLVAHFLIFRLLLRAGR